MSDTIRVSLKSKKFNLKVSDGIEIKREPEEKKIDLAALEAEKEAEIQRRIDDAWNEGFAEGRHNAKVELEASYSEKIMQRLSQVQGILDEVDQQLGEYDRAYEKSIVELSFRIAERIVRREIDRESIYAEVLKDAVKKVLGANQVIIKLNPDDLDNINSESDNKFVNDNFSQIKYEADNRCERGGCMVESDIGNLDARISTQLEEIKNKLDAYYNNLVGE